MSLSKGTGLEPTSRVPAHITSYWYRYQLRGDASSVRASVLLASLVSFSGIDGPDNYGGGSAMFLMSLR